MQAVNASDVVGLFAALEHTFATEREFLIALDGKVGDSDLGITMSKSFAAAHASVAAETALPVGKLLGKAGLAIAKAAPSTMGTLTATGFMRGGKALDGVTVIGVDEMAAFWRAYRDGVIERGKAKPGDKTVVDVLVPIADALDAAAAAGSSLGDALDAAVVAARSGLEATKSLVAQHGKAAAFRDRTRGLQDAGATVAVLIVTAFRDEVSGKAP